MKGYSDSTMQKWWRRAVVAYWGPYCAKCGSPQYQCHHVVGRRKARLRNDWRNGIPLCIHCHQWAHQLEGREWVESVLPSMEYLRRNDVVLTDWLQEQGINRKEFDKWQLEDLKKIVEEYGYDA